MKKLNDYDIAQSYIGKEINFEQMLKIFTENGDDGKEYIAYCDEFDQDQCSIFNITPTLSEYWECSGIEFSIYIDVDNDKIKDCFIFKYKETCVGYHGRPSGGELTPSQQEIRIFRRIMDYITRS